MRSSCSHLPQCQVQRKQKCDGWCLLKGIEQCTHALDKGGWRVRGCMREIMWCHAGARRGSNLVYLHFRLEKKLLDVENFLQPVMLPHLRPDDKESLVNLEAIRTTIKDMADDLQEKSSLEKPCDWRSFLMVVDDLLDRWFSHSCLLSTVPWTSLNRKPYFDPAIRDALKMKRDDSVRDIEALMQERFKVRESCNIYTHLSTIHARHPPDQFVRRQWDKHLSVSTRRLDQWLRRQYQIAIKEECWRLAF